MSEYSYTILSDYQTHFRPIACRQKFPTNFLWYDLWIFCAGSSETNREEMQCAAERKGAAHRRTEQGNPDSKSSGELVSGTAAPEQSNQGTCTFLHLYFMGVLINFLLHNKI